MRRKNQLSLFGAPKRAAEPVPDSVGVEAAPAKPPQVAEAQAAEASTPVAPVEALAGGSPSRSFEFAPGGAAAAGTLDVAAASSPSASSSAESSVPTSVESASEAGAPVTAASAVAPDPVEEREPAALAPATTKGSARQPRRDSATGREGKAAPPLRLVPAGAPAASATVPSAPPQLADAVDDEPPSGREQLAIPMAQKARRVDLPFSRRMSDLVRRLQLLERDAKAPLKLTLPQAHAIHALDESQSLRMQELAARLGLAQSTVTRLVAPLKRMGLLDRRPDQDDGRATRAFLTDAGREAVDQLDGVDRRLYGSVLERLPAGRRAEVVAAIELLHDAVLELTESTEA